MHSASSLSQTLVAKASGTLYSTLIRVAEHATSVTPPDFVMLLDSDYMIRMDLVLHLGVHKKLEKHRGCVNSISFNAYGNTLVSGSDDETIVLWDWEAGITKLAFHSGHSRNVLHAVFMPYSDDNTIVTCAADGEVRHAQILEGGQVSKELLAKHEGRAHKIATEPGNPCVFYSCGGDGVVHHFDLRTKSATKLFHCKSFEEKGDKMPVIVLNVISIAPMNLNHLALGGTDAYARVFDIRKYKWDGSNSWGQPIDCFCPPHMIGDKEVGITGLVFSDQSELLASYNDELIYLFSGDQGLGPNPLETNVIARSQVYRGHRNRDTLKGVTFFGPHCKYVASGSDCGHIFIWRKKDGELLRVMPADTHIVNCVEPHPHATLLASCGIEHNVKVWSPNAVELAPPISLDEVVMPIQYDFVAIGHYNENDDDEDSGMGSGDGNPDSNRSGDGNHKHDDDGSYGDEHDDDGHHLTQHKKRRLRTQSPP